MQYLRWLLLPFSLIYGLMVTIRNWLYDSGLFKTTGFDLPVISIGNLEVGGAGKSPMTEYLIRLLKPEHKLATLSRGYGRKTTGFLVADSTTTADQIGDEPAQFKQKFSDITVAVCEDRVTGAEQLKQLHNLILLDDAYQHRAIKPGLSILLFDYHKLFNPHFVLPAGDLREPFTSKWRANVFVVTKCPHGITEAEMTRCYYRLSPHPHQPLFFTAIDYLPLQPITSIIDQSEIDADTTVFLLTGIANPAPLEEHLKAKAAAVIHHNYPDHHQFTTKNIAKLAADYAACTAQKKVIITTEKDVQRLGVHDLAAAVSRLPILVAPIGISFLNNGQAEFNNIINNYVREHTQHH